MSGSRQTGLLCTSLFILKPTRLHGRGAFTRPPWGGQARCLAMPNSAFLSFTLYSESKRLPVQALMFQDKGNNAPLPFKEQTALTAPDRAAQGGGFFALYFELFYAGQAMQGASQPS